MVVIESFHHINLYASDIQKSIEFYTMFLDFEVLQEEESFALVTFDSLTLKLRNQGPVPKPYEDGDVPLLSFILDVDDFTDALQESEETNIQVLSGPNAIQHGESIVIQDPGGNLIELFYNETR